MKIFFKTIKLNLSECFACWGNISAILVTITAFVLPFFKLNLILNILYLFLSILIACIAAFLYIGIIKQKRTLYVRGNSKIICRYGDLKRLSIKENNAIIVIPVNDGFDMKITEPSDGGKPLVSIKSIHGKWIKFMEKYCNMNEENINRIVDEYLKSQGNKPIEILKHTNRRKNRYDIGTCAIVPGLNGNLYCLTVVSPTDDDNRTRGSKEILKESISKLLEFYDKKGQGYKLYVPLMGTGLSNSVTLGESYNIIYATLILTISNWCGEVNIVIYDGDKDKIAFNNGIRIK